MNNIQTLKDLQQYVKQGKRNFNRFGRVKVVEHNDMLLFNYTSSANFSGSMNFFEEISRGLILHARTGEIIALPFRKFYNWWEGGRHTKASILSSQEKVDGSLGILYRDAVDGELKICTRGSFNSDQALWATKYLHQNYNTNSFPENFTLLFEIVYPDNRIVVDYKGFEGLIFIGAINKKTGEDLTWDYSTPSLTTLAYELDFPIPKRYSFNNIIEILEMCENRTDTNFEGWVIRFSDGQRFKFKKDCYRELHKIVVNKNFNKLIANWMISGNANELIQTLPDSQKREARQIYNHYKHEIKDLYDKLIDIYETQIMWLPTRKDQALCINTKHKQIAHLLFKILDDKLTDNDLLQFIIRDI